MKTKKRLLSILLSLVLVLGLMPGMSLTAYATDNSVTFEFSNDTPDTSSGKYVFTKDSIELSSNNLQNDKTVYLDSVGNNFTVKVPDGKVMQEVSITVSGGQNPNWLRRDNNNNRPSQSGSVFTFSNINQSSAMFYCDATRHGPYVSVVTVKYEDTLVPVSNMTLAPTDSQTITVGDVVMFTATVSPDGATDKKVKWSVGGTNADAVKLYFDAACTTEVGTNATDTLTVYAKGASAGSATVTVTSNADSTKTASCTMTVNPVTYTVTYKVVNGTWSDDSTTDKTETVTSGSKPTSAPTGMKASEGFTGGAWDTNPAEATITEAKTFTYTFTAKQPATVTKAPTAKTLTYTGSTQELVTAGEAEGGTIQYALGTATEATEQYTTSIPAKTEAET